MKKIVLLFAVALLAALLMVGIATGAMAASGGGEAPASEFGISSEMAFV